MILTVLEAHVLPAQEAALLAAYRDAARGPFPPGLVRSVLTHSVSDPRLWRIETLWASREALEAMRGHGTPRGVLIFQAASATPALSIHEIIDTLSPEHGA